MFLVGLEFYRWKQKLQSRSSVRRRHSGLQVSLIHSRVEEVLRIRFTSEPVLADTTNEVFDVSLKRHSGLETMYFIHESSIFAFGFEIFEKPVILLS